MPPGRRRIPSYVLLDAAERSPGPRSLVFNVAACDQGFGAAFRMLLTGRARKPLSSQPDISTWPGGPALRTSCMVWALGRS